MDEKQKAILERNRGLLVGNMIMTVEFFQLLKTEHVLPDTMVADIQSKRTQEERNTTLLDILKLRGGDAYRKFRHVLYLSGHLFLADHLYGEDIETKVLRADEVLSKFPKVFQHISDDMKTKFLKYLETKVREKAVTNAWLTSASERSEVMESRKILFDAEKDYKIKLEVKAKKLIQLKEEIVRQSDEIKVRDEETLRVQKDIGSMQKTFKEDLAKQSRFNAANNHSIIQLRERFDQFNDRVRIINVAIRRFLDFDHHYDFDDDPDNVKLSLLERNVRTLIQIARTNIESTSSNVTEKEAVVNILKTSSRHKQQTLSEIVQQYVDKQEKDKLVLSKELDLLLDVVRGNKFTAKTSTKPKTDLKLLKSSMAIIREEVEHMKKKLEWKDNQITDLIKEISDLRETSLKQTTAQKVVSFPYLTSPHAHRETPDSTKELDKVYQHFDRYVGETNTPPPSRRHSIQRRGSLADVNLERGISPSPGLKSRRNSRFDTTDLDILGTSPQYRRSLSDLRSTETFGNIASASSSSIEKKYSLITPRPQTEDNIKLDMIRRRDSHKITEPATDFIKEGRRPSLAELITIYETSQDGSPPGDQKGDTRLPLLQEI